MTPKFRRLARVVSPILAIAVRQRFALALWFLPIASTLAAGGTNSVAQGLRSSGTGPIRHGLRADGSAWLWPGGAKELSIQERDRVFRRTLNGEIAMTWSLDRGEGDLEFVSGESRVDPSLVTEEVRVRATFRDGKTQDFPTRVVLGLDRNRSWGSIRVPDGMVVEALLPCDSGITKLQLIDHKGMLAWEAEPKETLFSAPGNRRAPVPGKDYVPAPGFQPSLASDRPAEGKIDPRVEARRELQNAYIKAGIYPPYQIVLKEGPSGR